MEVHRFSRVAMCVERSSHTKLARKFLTRLNRIALNGIKTFLSSYQYLIQTDRILQKDKILLFNPFAIFCPFGQDIAKG